MHSKSRRFAAPRPSAGLAHRGAPAPGRHLGSERIGNDAVVLFRDRHAFRPGRVIHLAPRAGLVHLFDKANGVRIKQEGTMLNGIDKRLKADALHAMEEMGHGDVPVRTATDFPAASIARFDVNDRAKRACDESQTGEIQTGERRLRGCVPFRKGVIAPDAAGSA